MMDDRKILPSLIFKVALAVLLLSGLGYWILSWGSDDLSQPSTKTTLLHKVKKGSLIVSVTEQGTLESSDNTEIKCKVRGRNTVIWVVESGKIVEPGEVLVRLDTLYIEEQINERSKYAHWSRSGAEYWRAKVARAKLAIPEYTQGRYVAQMMTLKKDLAIAESNLSTAKNMLAHAQMMYERGYRSELEVEERKFQVKQAELSVDVKKTEIEVLRDYTRKMELETLNGDLKAAEAEFSASDERAFADAARRDRAVEEHKHCVVKATRKGMVIYPSQAAWKNAPDIEEGATVHKDQILLLMPDLSKMQVKVGIHESIIDRVSPGLKAVVSLPDNVLHSEVTSVSSIARPAGWWTGNAVKYDTIVKLPETDKLKPGMSAAVRIVLAEYHDVLTVPVASVLETETGTVCWVKSGNEFKKRVLVLGDTDDMFIVVKEGLKEGEEIVLNPLALIPEAQKEALKPYEQLDKKSDSESSPKSEPKDGSGDSP